MTKEASMGKLVTLILSFLAPPLGIASGLFQKLFQWRPSLSTVISLVVIILSLGALTVQTVRINGLHLAPKIIFFKLKIIDIDGYKEINDKLVAAIKDRDNKEKEYRQSQIKENAKVTTISKTGAEIINDSRKQLQPKIDKFVDDYIRNHPVPQCVRRTTDTSVFDGKSDLSGKANTPPSSNGTDLPPQWVAISVTDLKGYTQNTRDLDDLRAYFKWLIDRNLAEPYKVIKEEPKK